MIRLEIARERSCWTRDYVLAHCEHYRVESEAGKLGYVEELVRTPGGELLGLLVRGAHGETGRSVVPITDVVGLYPSAERIVVRAPTNRADRPAPESRVRRGKRSLGDQLSRA